MSSCPSVRCRNTGSGYVKESQKEGSGLSLAARLAEREAQDRAAQFTTSPVVEVHPTTHHPSSSGAIRDGTSCSTNISQYSEKR